MNISRPTLLLDREKCRKNILEMYEKAAGSGVYFRPHFKTHQSAGIGEWFRETGAMAITVSSVRMAAYFADHGWDDITIAFPLNIREIKEVNRLAEKTGINLLVTGSEPIEHIRSGIHNHVGIFLKIDTGYQRTGIPSGETGVIQDLIDQLMEIPVVRFRGFLTHSGHTYKASTAGEIRELYHDTVNKLLDLKSSIAGTDQILLSIGDTPSCSLIDRFDLVDEIRPGNFVFYDLMQYQLGSCSLNQIAVALAVPVVARHPERNEAVVYGGAVHLSKEYLTLPSGEKIYGKVVELYDEGWSLEETGGYVTGLSQEHGIVKVSAPFLDRIRVGDLLGILPVHSCLTAHLMKGYVTTDGEKIDHMESTC